MEIVGWTPNTPAWSANSAMSIRCPNRPLPKPPKRRSDRPPSQPSGPTPWMQPRTWRTHGMTVRSLPSTSTPSPGHRRNSSAPNVPGSPQPSRPRRPRPPRPGPPEFVVVIDADAPGHHGPVAEFSIPVEIPARVLANRAQRRALRALYRCCSIPGCTVSYDRCKLHHIIWWRNGGHTNLDKYESPQWAPRIGEALRRSWYPRCLPRPVSADRHRRYLASHDSSTNHQQDGHFHGHGHGHEPGPPARPRPPRSKRRHRGNAATKPATPTEQQPSPTRPARSARHARARSASRRTARIGPHTCTPSASPSGRRERPDLLPERIVPLRDPALTRRGLLLSHRRSSPPPRLDSRDGIPSAAGAGGGGMNDRAERRDVHVASIREVPR